jgi:hypothetical protein
MRMKFIANQQTGYVNDQFVLQHEGAVHCTFNMAASAASFTMFFQNCKIEIMHLHGTPQNT